MPGEVHLKVLPVIEMMKFECPRGHKFERFTPMVVVFDTVHTGSICPYCYAAWITQNFGATDVSGGNLPG